MSDLMNEQDQQQINELDELLKKDPTNVDALIRKGFILYDCVKDDEAIETFKQAIKINSQCVDAYFWLAECLWDHIADYEQAAFFAREALKINPNRADIHRILSMIIKDYNGDNSTYEFHLRKTIELEPTWITPRVRLIQYLIEQRSFVLAKQEIQEAFNQLQENFPIPKDRMQQHYEGLITGRSNKKNRKYLEELQRTIEENRLKM